jgi:hypothetical protein
VLAMAAEFEADLIRSRTREGMRAGKAKGHLRGKQPKHNPRREAHLVELLHSGGYSTTERGRCPTSHAPPSSGPQEGDHLGRSNRRWQSIHRACRAADSP